MRRRDALIASVLLSAIFLIVYGACSWVTAQRADVGTFYFEWERFIPFVPIFIIPYLSIDLFFVAAPFFCSDREEMWLLGKRITLAIVVAAACFLAFPLTLAVPRPQPDGWLGTIYQWFCTLDRPFNLFPSLHIAFRTLLAEHYARHTSGLRQRALQIWFSLIGVSTLLTYQHHVIDIVGGFILAAVCFYFVTGKPLQWALTPNPWVGGYYAVGAVALIAAAVFMRWWGMWLLWPAFACGVVASGYFFVGPDIYQKEDGKLSLLSRVLLAPVLLGQWLSLRYYQRQCRPWDEVAPGVIIGRQLTDPEAAQLLGEGVTAVLDLTPEFPAPAPFLKVNYRFKPILDLTAPARSTLFESVAFIRLNIVNKPGKIYVHCKAGYSRSGAVAAAWMLAEGQVATVDEALARLRAARPSIVVRPEADEALVRFARAL